MKMAEKAAERKFKEAQQRRKRHSDFFQARLGLSQQAAFSGTQHKQPFRWGGGAKGEAQGTPRYGYGPCFKCNRSGHYRTLL